MRIAVALLALFTILTGSNLYAGGVIKGGGGMVMCTTASNPNFIYDWMTDYYITGEDQSDVAKPWQERCDVSHGGVCISENWFPHFVNSIHSKLPPNAFEWYHQLEKKMNSDTSGHSQPTLFSWEILPDNEVPPLQEIQPEILAMLPADCLEPELVLFILRIEDEPGRVAYKYNRKFNNSGIASLQLSFLIVHEWLWNFSHDANIVRNANRYIHSQKFYDASSQEALMTLQKLGIPIMKYEN